LNYLSGKLQQMFATFVWRSFAIASGLLGIMLTTGCSQMSSANAGDTALPSGSVSPSVSASPQIELPTVNAQAPARQLDVPYVPTPPEVVAAMLQVANVGKNDVLYDLGSGDGRIPIAAAKQFGTRGLGVDLDPERVREATANAKKEKVDNLVTFKQQDLFQADLSQATVITLYLLPDVNLKLRPKLLALKPGTRIVSHAFDMGDWKPEKVLKVNGRTVYYWVVPNRAPANLRN
jgi:Methyltransferase domain